MRFRGLGRPSSRVQSSVGSHYDKIIILEQSDHYNRLLLSQSQLNCISFRKNGLLKKLFLN